MSKHKVQLSIHYIEDSLTGAFVLSGASLVHQADRMVKPVPPKHRAWLAAVAPALLNTPKKGSR